MPRKSCTPEEIKAMEELRIGGMPLWQIALRLGRGTSTVHKHLIIAAEHGEEQEYDHG